MIIKSGKKDIDAIKFFKENLIYQIENIKEFEAYFEDTEPYCEIDEDGYKQYYHLIIRDEYGTELWIDSNCGYSGGGPSQTEHILQLLGVRKDYRITEKRSIKESNIETDLSLNLLVSSWDRQTNSEDIWNHHFMGCANFRYPSQRLNAINTLEKFGHITHFNKEDYRVSSYFANYDLKDNSFGEYRINNIYTLNTNVKNAFNTNDFKIITSAAIINAGGTIEFHEINKTN